MTLSTEQRNSVIIPLNAARDWFVMSSCVNPELKEKYEGFAFERLRSAVENAGYDLVERPGQVLR